MAKEKIELPEFNKVTSVDEIEDLIHDAEKAITRKYKLRRQAEQAKADINSSYGEQIKQLKEELDYQVAVVSGWQERIRIIGASGGSSEDTEPEAPRVVEEQTAVGIAVGITGVSMTGLPGTPATQVMSTQSPWPPSQQGSVVPFPTRAATG